MIKTYLLYLIFQIITYTLFAQKAIIPFQINEDNRIVLDYSIKNKNLNFVFDTGLSFNILDKNVSNDINFACVNNDKVHTIYNINGVPIEIMHYNGPRELKMDSIFWGSWFLTDMKVTEAKLKLGTNIDGVLGYGGDDIIELNFEKQKLKIWETLPVNYVEEMLTVRLVNTCNGHETKNQISPYISCIKSQFVILDSTKLKPNFILDTGSPSYLVLIVYDSLLLKSMIDFKKQTIKIKGENEATTKLIIPELKIDSSFCKIEVIPKCYENKDGFNMFNDKVGGLLGVQFFQQFKRVIIDKKNKLAYFEE